MTTAANHQPLAGKRIVITRAAAQAQPMLDALRTVGAVPILFPTIQIAPIADNVPLDSALQHVDEYDSVIFTSVNGVDVVLDRMRALHIAPTRLNALCVIVIGPATATALHDHGVRVDVQPPEYVAESIVETLRAQNAIAGRRFLLLRADIARATLREQLIAGGAAVAEIPVYHTIHGTPSALTFDEMRAGVDIITFSSSSTVRNFCDLLGDEAHTLTERALIACIGPITAQTARELGLRVDVVANDYTIAGLLTALTEHLTP